MRILGLAALAALAAACVTTTDESYAVPAIHKQAAFDLDCPSSQLQIMETSDNVYGVKGCDKRTSYRVASCDTVADECQVSRTSPIVAD